MGKVGSQRFNCRVTVTIVNLIFFFTCGAAKIQNPSFLYSCPTGFNCRASPFSQRTINTNLELTPNHLQHFQNIPRPSINARQPVFNNKSGKRRKTNLAQIGSNEIARVEKCDGYENFMHDIEIVAVILTSISYFKGIVGLILHILNQAYIFFSVFMVGGPERLTWLIEQIREHTIDPNLHRVIEWIGFLDYLVIKLASFPTGNVIIILGVISHALGGISLGIDWMVSFKGEFRDMVLGVSGVDLERVFEGYGCNNPLEPTIISAFQNIINLASSVL